MSTMTNGAATGGRQRIPVGKSFVAANEVPNDGTEKSGQIYFEPGSYSADGPFIFVRNPTIFELRRAYRLLVAEIGGQLAPLSVVQSVYGHNRLSWWTIHQSANASRARAKMVGVCAYLPLTEPGLEALKAGRLDALDPNLDLLASRGEEPAALYLWAIVAHGLSDIAGKLIGHAIGLDLYETLPILGTIGTEQGLAALKRSTKSATAAAELKIGSVFEIKLTPKHIQDERAMRIYEPNSLSRVPPREHAATVGV